MARPRPRKSGMTGSWAPAAVVGDADDGALGAVGAAERGGREDDALVFLLGGVGVLDGVGGCLTHGPYQVVDVLGWPLPLTQPVSEQLARHPRGMGVSGQLVSQSRSPRVDAVDSRQHLTVRFRHRFPLMLVRPPGPGRLMT